MVLTIELFTTHGRGANGSNCVCASVCVAGAFGVRMSERGWWSQWSTQWREKGGKMRAGRMAASWVMFAKVKNHATVLRALDLPTGTSDYIHAGTQVLLNTPSLVLLPRQAPFHYLQPPPPLSPGPPQVWSRYKSLFAVQVPPHVFSAVARSLSRETTWNPLNTEPAKPRCHTSLPPFYEHTVVVVWICLSLITKVIAH